MLNLGVDSPTPSSVSLVTGPIPLPPISQTAANQSGEMEHSWNVNAWSAHTDKEGSVTYIPKLTRALQTYQQATYPEGALGNTFDMPHPDPLQMYLSPTHPTQLLVEPPSRPPHMLDQRADLDVMEQPLNTASIDRSLDLMGVSCTGIQLDLPSAYRSYPFQLHDRVPLPWGVLIWGNQLRIRSIHCQGTLPGSLDPCGTCSSLLRHPIVEGIVQRATLGTHENTPRDYLSVGNLLQSLERKTSQIDEMRITCLNNAKRLLSQAGVLNEHKRFVMAIGSGRVERVHALVSAALCNGSGIKQLITTYEKVAIGLY